MTSHHTRSMNILGRNLETMSSNSLEKFENEYGVKSVAIHRAELHRVLLRHLSETSIHLNKKVKALDQRDGLVHLSFEDGTSHTAELVIGADGIRSVVRQTIVDNSKLRDAGQICWRGISYTKIDKRFKGELNEIWGRGSRFGFVHISENEIY